MKEPTLTTARPLLAALLVAALGACGVTEAPPTDHFYRLNVSEAPVRAGRAPLPGVLEVARFTADGLLADRPIAYVLAEEPHEVFDYNYHFWNQPPGELLQDQLILFLRSANTADRVLSPDLRLPADYVVEGRIRRFEQRFGDGVSMVVQLELGVVRLADEKLLLLKNYLLDEPAAGDGIDAAVAATNEALARIFAEFAADLARLEVGS